MTRRLILHPEQIDIDLVAQKPARTIDTRPLFGTHGLTFVDGAAVAIKSMATGMVVG